MRGRRAQGDEGDGRSAARGHRRRVGGDVADLTSVRKDIKEAETYVGQLQAMPASTHTSPEHQVTRPALWKAVAISYRRAFTTGKSFTKGRSRSRYPSDIFESLSDADRATHEAILDDADRHIAHRVDDDREAAEGQGRTPPAARPRGDGRVLVWLSLRGRARRPRASGGAAVQAPARQTRQRDQPAPRRRTRTGQRGT